MKKTFHAITMKATAFKTRIYIFTLLNILRYAHISVLHSYLVYSVAIYRMVLLQPTLLYNIWYKNMKDITHGEFQLKE